MSAEATITFPVLERAKEAVGAKSDYELAKYLGITTPTMSGYRKRQSLPLDQCVKIAEQTSVSLDWLILGKGERKAAAVSLPDNEDIVLVPLYDIYASAGGGISVFGEAVERYIPFERVWLRQNSLQPDEISCIKISGDSMEPTLADGDIILVNTAAISGDGVFVIRMGDVLRVKRIQFLADARLRVSSDNPRYAAEEIDLKKADEYGFAVIGRCASRISQVS